MNPDDIKQMLQEVSEGRLGVELALDRLRSLPFEDLGFARVDRHRKLRTGFPEVVFGQDKTTEHILAIAESILQAGGPLLVTRLPEASAEALKKEFPNGVHNHLARTFHVTLKKVTDQGRGIITVLAAGTSDLPVAEEAVVTATLMGNQVERLIDVGVAGIHRLLSDRDQLEKSEVLIVVAGMEGALPSVVGGLVGRPIIAVPTSVGYGASLGGLAALLGMLNSCAAGVCVVNIDNGFGAGYAAALINRRRKS